MFRPHTAGSQSMNRTTLISAAAVALAATLLLAGPLNPPAGPVASTYKTLSEVEPRIAIGGAGVIRSCVAASNRSHGFAVTNSGTALQGCVAYSNTGAGFLLSGSCSAIDCAAESNSGGGYRLLGGCALHGCTASTNGV